MYFHWLCHFTTSKICFTLSEPTVKKSPFTAQTRRDTLMSELELCRLADFGTSGRIQGSCFLLSSVYAKLANRPLAEALHLTDSGESH